MFEKIIGNRIIVAISKKIGNTVPYSLFPVNKNRIKSIRINIDGVASSIAARYINDMFAEYFNRDELNLRNTCGVLLWQNYFTITNLFFSTNPFSY